MSKNQNSFSTTAHYINKTPLDFRRSFVLFIIESTAHVDGLRGSPLVVVTQSSMLILRPTAQHSLLCGNSQMICGTFHSFIPTCAYDIPHVSYNISRRTNRRAAVVDYHMHILHTWYPYNDVYDIYSRIRNVHCTTCERRLNKYHSNWMSPWAAPPQNDEDDADDDDDDGAQHTIQTTDPTRPTTTTSTATLLSDAGADWRDAVHEIQPPPNSQSPPPSRRPSERASRAPRMANSMPPILCIMCECALCGTCITRLSGFRIVYCVCGCVCVVQKKGGWRKRRAQSESVFTTKAVWGLSNIYVDSSRLYRMRKGVHEHPCALLHSKCDVCEPRKRFYLFYYMRKIHEILVMLCVHTSQQHQQQQQQRQHIIANHPLGLEACIA